MKKIYFIINKDSNHKNIIHNGGGASELLFYMTAYKLSNFFNVTIFNRDIPSIIDNIQYLYLTDDRNIDIQRMVDLHKKIYG